MKSKCLPGVARLLVAGWLAVCGLPLATAQTGSVAALIDQMCAGTRAGSNLGCTANDFAASLTFNQPTANAIASCVAGQSITLDVIATLSSGSPNRFAAGAFLGQTGNLPSLNNAANMCSVGVFPSTPTPFANLDGSTACGDFLGSSTATLQITGVKVACLPAPGTNELSIPYLVAWDNQSAPSCTASNLTASTNSKCVENGSAFVVGVRVQGWIKIIKQTNPASSTQTFNFSTASSPTSVITPVNATLTGGQSQTFTFPLNPSGSVQQITVTEALSAGWESTATIACTTPSGGPAAYVTVNNANRTISGNFGGANYGAICTITNNKQTRVRARKTVPNSDTGTFDLTVQTNLASSTTPNLGNGGLTPYVQRTAGSVTVSESSGAGGSITKYVTAVACLNDDTGVPILPASSVLSGSTRSAVISPPAFADASCTFTNTRTANLAVSKANGTASLVAGQSTTYTLTASNAGPSDADGAVLIDPVAAGLVCTSVSCTAVTGAAVCPAPPGVTTAALQGAGIVLPTVPMGSSLTFSVACTVSATGT